MSPTPEISIIIPVYNGERHIAACIDSILSQSTNCYEIICIDDGSKDQSLSILKDYEQKHACIHAFSQENAGVSVARNKGILEAKGNYAIFLDADDCLHPLCLESLLQVQRKHPDTWVMFGVKRFENKEWPSCLADIPHPTRGDVPMIPYALNAFGIMRLKIFAFNKIFKIQVLRDAHIEFLPGVPLNEDLHFTLHYAMQQSNCILVPLAFYYYRNNEQSACGTLLDFDRPAQHYLNHIDIFIPLMQQSCSFAFKKRIAWQMGLYLRVKYQTTRWLRLLKNHRDPRPDVREGFAASMRKFKSCTPLYARIPMDLVNFAWYQAQSLLPSLIDIVKGAQYSSFLSSFKKVFRGK